MRIGRQNTDPLFALAVLCFTLACSATHHGPEPYRSDPVVGADLSARAAAFCAAENPDAPQPVKPFLTDGCSLFIDANWDLDCCIEHDIKYWCGGSAEQREAADRAFGECVGANSARIVGKEMELGVRVGGHPIWPTRYRWGMRRRELLEVDALDARHTVVPEVRVHYVKVISNDCYRGRHHLIRRDTDPLR